MVRFIIINSKSLSTPNRQAIHSIMNVVASAIPPLSQEPVFEPPACRRPSNTKPRAKLYPIGVAYFAAPQSRCSEISPVGRSDAVLTSWPVKVYLCSWFCCQHPCARDFSCKKVSNWFTLTECQLSLFERPKWGAQENVNRFVNKNPTYAAMETTKRVVYVNVQWSRGHYSIGP